MSSFSLAAAAALTASSIFAVSAEAASVQVVTGGSATIEFNSALLADSNLGTNWTVGASGNPSRTLNVTPTRQNDDGSLSFSQVVKGGAALTLSRSTVYLYPVGTAADPAAEVESFADVKIFNFRETDPSVTAEMKAINYVPTGTPGQYTDIKTGATHTLTPAQEALLRDSRLRTCCRHTLGGMVLNTAGGFIDGVIDNIAQRDINFDGVIDASDDFVLFDLVKTNDESVFDIALSDVFAQFLSIAYTPGAFLDGSTLGDWTRGSPLLFAGGDVVGRVSYSYTTESVPSLAPVPVPAALPMLAGGLGLMGFVARRRKRAA